MASCFSEKYKTSHANRNVDSYPDEIAITAIAATLWNQYSSGKIISFHFDKDITACIQLGQMKISSI
jgi:hypothetical protein